MRRALIVGIDDYPFAPLNGCVNDANKMYEILCRNEDKSPNFDCRVILNDVTKSALKKAIEDLFKDDVDVALLYFSGHGTENNLGGYIVTQDANSYDEGVSVNDILTYANNSKAKERIIILDSCHSGSMGQLPVIDNVSSVLKEGVSILTSSKSHQLSYESNGSGVFTTLVCDALVGGAADVLGKVNVASVYAYVDQALGGWDQRPLFKSHVSKLISLRMCRPIVDIELLRLLPKYFEEVDKEFQLDPSFEYTHADAIEENTEVLKTLQKFRAARLLAPFGVDHLYDACIGSKKCGLTPLGKFYWLLANSGRI